MFTHIQHIYDDCLLYRKGVQTGYVRSMRRVDAGRRKYIHYCQSEGNESCRYVHNHTGLNPEFNEFRCQQKNRYVVPVRATHDGPLKQIPKRLEAIATYRRPGTVIHMQAEIRDHVAIHRGSCPPVGVRQRDTASRVPKFVRSTDCLPPPTHPVLFGTV